MVTKWVLIDESAGAKTGDGSSLDPATLTRIASACDGQMNGEWKHFYGGEFQIRAGRDSKDIQPGEQVYLFVATLEQAPGASAYHDTDGNGVPVAYCAVTTCGSLLGPDGVSVDASHEILEAAGDPSCNIMADNLQGLLIAFEVCDPVEVQTYPSYVDSGVQVSNFVLPSWFDPKAPAPYDFMSEAGFDSAVAPPGPLQIAPGNGGNYIISETSGENQTDTFGLIGTSRKGRRDTASRFMRRLMGRQFSRKGKLAMADSGTTQLTVNNQDIRTGPVLDETPAAERVKAETPTSDPGVRQQMRTIPVSLKHRNVLGTTVPLPKDVAPAVTPREITAASVQAAQRYMSRVDVRAASRTPKGQVDQQKQVLAGRARLRGGPKPRP